MSKIRVELSGLGHYGICTIMPRALFQQCAAMIDRSAFSKDWYYSSDHHNLRSGINGSLRLLNPYQATEEVRLGWLPNRLADASRSHGQLMMVARAISADEEIDFDNGKTGRDLVVDCGIGASGWYNKANFGDEVWDVIEGPLFPDLLAGDISTAVGLWYEDHRGIEKRRPTGTLFEGRDGLTLQLDQDASHGTWIVGQRKTHFLADHQFHDHNTDCLEDVLGHIFSLCTVLKYCRAVLPPVEQKSLPEADTTNVIS